MFNFSFSPRRAGAWVQVRGAIPRACDAIYVGIKVIRGGHKTDVHTTEGSADEGRAHHDYSMCRGEHKFLMLNSVFNTRSLEKGWQKYDKVSTRQTFL